MNQTIYRLLGKNVYPLAAYCAPQSACESGGVRYASKITQQQYDLLADAGINLFYGHSEVAGGANSGDVLSALDCAARAGAGYLPRFEEAQEYVSLGTRGYPDYRTLSAAAKEELDGRFARSLEKYASHPAFFGISFIDEPGAEMFAGIAAAKKVFEKVCRGKFFYVNMFPYYITPEQYQYSFGSGALRCTRKEFFTDRSNIERYRDFAREFVQTVRPEVYSYDAYPFVTLGEGAETGVHEVLYDIPAFLAREEKKTGVPFWMFMQEGGKWEGNEGVRIPGSAEHRLQYNVGLAYGAKGLQLFPCCYPNDWLSDHVCRAGLVDRNGAPTDMYGYFRREARQVRAAGAFILGAEWTGMMAAGDFSGLLAPESVLAKIKWNECIYRGRLTGGKEYLLHSHGCLESAAASSQILIGCFEKEGKNGYYVVNNSVTTSSRVELCFTGDAGCKIIRGGETYTACGRKLSVVMEAGEGMLVIPEIKEVK